MSASWINKLNESDSRLHKEDVIKQALEACVLGSTNAQIFLGLVKACYNPFITFGVRKVPDTVGIVDGENPWHEYNDLLIKLTKRELTGNAAHTAIEEMAYRFDSVEWNNFCAPVIRRDLRCGISDKTINKICKKTEYEIPVFGCQLATNSEGRPEMKGIKRLEPKLDGVRVLMVVIYNDAGEVVTTCYSRNGKVFENFTHIEEQVSNNFTKLVRTIKDRYGSDFTTGFVFDGEVIGNTFQELMRQARRKENVQAEDSVFNVFDILPLASFREGHWNAQLHKRIKILEDLRSVFDDMPNVEDVSVELVKEYLSYEPDTGLIYWVKSPSKNVYAGELAGCNKATRKDKNGNLVLKRKYGKFKREPVELPNPAPDTGGDAYVTLNF